MAQQEAVVGKPRELTEEEGAFYREHGWVHLERFVEPGLAAELLQAAKQVMGEQPSAAVEADDHVAFKRGGGRVVDIGSWQDYHFVARDDGVEPFRSLVFSREIGAAAARLVGRDVPIQFGSDLLAVKMPAGQAGGGPTIPHQDVAQFPHDRFGNIAFWIALNDLPPQRGVMRFVDKSHRAGVLGRTLNEHGDLFQIYPWLSEYGISPELHLKPGDATAHNAATIHMAPENSTAEPRWAYIAAYFPGDILYTGSPNHNYDGLGLEINKPIRHERFPIVFP